MTGVFVYSTIAILALVAIAWLARERSPGAGGRTRDMASAQRTGLGVPGNGQFLKISDRIFDPGDFVWLRDAVGRRDLARQLAASRQRLAVQWLRTLRYSFNELLRTPQPAPLQGNADSAQGSWELLWLTARFHLLLAYAVSAVRIFGPYHRLVPSPNWRRFLPEPASPKRRFSTVN